jgi:hypothetical protein
MAAFFENDQFPERLRHTRHRRFAKHYCEIRSLNFLCKLQERKGLDAAGCLLALVPLYGRHRDANLYAKLRLAHGAIFIAQSTAEFPDRSHYFCIRQ